MNKKIIELYENKKIPEEIDDRYYNLFKEQQEMFFLYNERIPIFINKSVKC